jgi:hypothetical protein
MDRLCIITAEVLVEPGDLGSGHTKAFVPVVTWAERAGLSGDRGTRQC